jgi:uncharacterized membrane protein
MTSVTRNMASAIRHPRLLTGVVAAGVAFVVVRSFFSWTHSFLIAFDTGVLLYFVLVMGMMGTATIATIKRRAKIHEDGRWTILLVSVAAVAAVFGALTNELHAVKAKSLFDIAIACITIVLAWLFVAVTFAQHYAHRFYISTNQLQFPGTDDPDYWDFLYFAAVLSMCCQTSDVAVTASPMRRIVLLQSLASFFFNVIIISMMVSMITSAL